MQGNRNGLCHGAHADRPSAKQGSGDLRDVGRPGQASALDFPPNGLEEQIANLGHAASHHHHVRVDQVYEACNGDAQLSACRCNDPLGHQVTPASRIGYVFCGDRAFSQRGQLCLLFAGYGFLGQAGDCGTACKGFQASAISTGSNRAVGVDC